jgi:hypothetical protein
VPTTLPREFGEALCKPEVTGSIPVGSTRRSGPADQAEKPGKDRLRGGQ